MPSLAWSSRPNSWVQPQDGEEVFFNDRQSLIIVISRGTHHVRTSHPVRFQDSFRVLSLSQVDPVVVTVDLIHSNSPLSVATADIILTDSIRITIRNTFNLPLHCSVSLVLICTFPLPSQMWRARKLWSLLFLVDRALRLVEHASHFLVYTCTQKTLLHRHACPRWWWEYGLSWGCWRSHIEPFPLDSAVNFILGIPSVYLRNRQ